MYYYWLFWTRVQYKTNILFKGNYLDSRGKGAAKFLDYKEEILPPPVVMSQ